MAGRILICMLLVLFSAVDGMATESLDGSKKVIKVGGNSAYPPYEFIDTDGKPSGFVVELTQAIAETMGFQVVIRLDKSWTEMRRALERGEVDVLQGISFSEEREKILDFSPPHSLVSHSIFARKGAPPVSSLDELRGKEVILMGRGVMHDYFVEAGLPIHPITAPTVADALKLLSSGKYEYAVLATLPASYLIKNLGIENVDMIAKSIDTKQYCYAVKKGNLAVLAKFNEGMALLKETGKYRELQDKWLGAVETHSVAWTWLARHSLIIVASLLLGLLVSVIWSRILKMQVAVRTAALKHEIEERMRAAEELKLHQQRMIQADKMAALGVLVSSMAHEINNPNGLILLNLPLINEMMTDIEPILTAHYREHGDFPMGGLAYSRMCREVPQLLDEMQDAAKRIKRMVDDLKHFSKKSDADFKELVDVNNVVRTSLRLVEHSLRRSAIHCTVHYAEPIPLITGNSHRLEQVIVNLLLNAAQAIESSSSRDKPDMIYKPLVNVVSSSKGIPNAEKGILISTMFDQATGTVVVKVHDDGVGIPPEHLHRLTDPFFTTKRDTGGTGLGLAISTEIIKEHGGSIHFESLSNEGATVIVRLPTAAVEVRS
jgi:polar amino acid transport system substrate-binding protein